MLVLIRPPSFVGRRRDCLFFWLAVAITFDGLNPVDSRSGHRERSALRRRFIGSSAMRLQSMIGSTALIVESEMFRDRQHA